MTLHFVNGNPDQALIGLGTSLSPSLVFLEVDRLNKEVRAGIQGETVRILLPRNITVAEVNNLLTRRAADFSELEKLAPFSDDEALFALELSEKIHKDHCERA